MPKPPKAVKERQLLDAVRALAKPWSVSPNGGVLGWNTYKPPVFRLGSVNRPRVNGIEITLPRKLIHADVFAAMTNYLCQWTSTFHALHMMAQAAGAPPETVDRALLLAGRNPDLPSAREVLAEPNSPSAFEFLRQFAMLCLGDAATLDVGEEPTTIQPGEPTTIQPGNGIGGATLDGNGTGGYVNSVQPANHAQRYDSE